MMDLGNTAQPETGFETRDRFDETVTLGNRMREASARLSAVIDDDRYSSDDDAVIAEYRRDVEAARADYHQACRECDAAEARYREACRRERL